ncbi:unnamed protein product, partial [Porites evermanni]
MEEQEKISQCWMTDDLEAIFERKDFSSVADTTPEFSASSTDISSVNVADDVEKGGSGDKDIDLYSPKTQGKCLALATG